MADLAAPIPVKPTYEQSESPEDIPHKAQVLLHPDCKSVPRHNELSSDIVTKNKGRGNRAPTSVPWLPAPGLKPYALRPFF